MSYVEIDIKVNRSVVFDLLDDLRLAWEKILNDYPPRHRDKTVEYMEGAMAVHNFHKLALNHIMAESGMEPEQRVMFLRAMRDTFSRAIDVDIQKVQKAK